MDKEHTGTRLKPPQPRGKPSTADILGAGAANDLAIAPKWAGHYAQLMELRDYLTGQKQLCAEDARIEPGGAGIHMAEGATDSYDRDWSLAMASSDQTMLFEIDEALNRIRSGSYGRCELTRQPIEAARLRAIPWTRFSARAQTELEARGIATRTQLGKLGAYAQAAEGAGHSEEDVEEELALAGAEKE